MKNLYIYCEGQTEESFINNVLYPYLFNIGIFVRPIICTTKRTKIEKFKGGISNYQKIKNELLILCKQHKNEMLTTMFDYYGMPNNTPGINNMSDNLYERVSRIEKTIESDINAPNLFFNLIVHEFESLLFVKTSAFQGIADDDTIIKLQEIKNRFTSPEHINNSVYTAPSKRINELIPDYAKLSDGTIISERIGIDAMLGECEHFCDWVTKIKLLSK
jgi:hypothetical protein